MDEREHEARHQWRWRALSTWIAIFSLIVAYSVRENRERSQEGIEAKVVLCNFKNNLSKRISRTEKFLIDNPGPVILGNIPRSIVEQGLTEDRKTLAASQNLKCPLDDLP